MHNGTGRVTRDKKIIAGFGRLCSREYWERLWIIQEIMLASRLEVHCGELTLPWKYLEAAVLENAWALDIVYASSVARLCRKKVAMKPAGRTSQTAIPGASLLSLVIFYAEAKCADSRDKLYGLHSFAPDCCRAAVPIDYSRSAYDICQSLFQHEIGCHDFKMPYSVLSIAFKIHEIFVGGAFGQPNSTFEAGSRTWQEFGSNHPQRKIMSRIQAVFDGDVCWVSSPLRDLWRGRQDMWVPREVLHTPIRMTSHAILAQISCVEVTQEAGSVVPIDPDSKSSSWRIPLVPTFESRSNGRSKDLDLVKVTKRSCQQKAAYFHEFLLSVYHIYHGAKSNTLNDCVLFWTTENLIGFAPTGTRITDSIYQFSNYSSTKVEISVLVRGDNSNPEIIMAVKILDKDVILADLSTLQI